MSQIYKTNGNRPKKINFSFYGSRVFVFNTEYFNKIDHYYLDIILTYELRFSWTEITVFNLSM